MKSMEALIMHSDGFMLFNRHLEKQMKNKKQKRNSFFDKVFDSMYIVHKRIP